MLLAGKAPLRGQNFAPAGGGQSRAANHIWAYRACLQSMQQQPTICLLQEWEPPAHRGKKCCHLPHAPGTSLYLIFATVSFILAINWLAGHWFWIIKRRRFSHYPVVLLRAAKDARVGLGALCNGVLCKRRLFCLLSLTWRAPWHTEREGWALEYLGSLGN